MAPIISVIIPVYNAEKYLHRCLISILEQTFTNFEVLLVDDGSSDSSGKICDSFAVKDKRVKVFHKANGGATAARAYGVQNASGIWINFVDSDDYIPSNSLAMLFHEIKNEEIDIVVGACRDYGSFLSVAKSIALKGVVDGSSYLKAMLNADCGSGPVCRLIRKSLFNSETFNLPREIINNEDLIMNIRLAKSARLVSINPGLIVYNYYNNPGSISKKKISIECWNRIFEYVKSCAGDECEKYVARYILRTIYSRQDEINYRDLNCTQFLHENSTKDFISYSYLKIICNNSFFYKILINIYKAFKLIKRLLLYIFSKH